MARNLYEKECDLVNERRIAQAIIDATGWKLHKLPIKYRADYIATNKNDIAHSVLEFKKRGICKNQYEYVFLSLDKYETCMRLYNRYDLDFYFFVEFMDGLYYSKNPICEKIKVAGRTDRNDPDDIEPIALLPSVDFFPISDLIRL